MTRRCSSVAAVWPKRRAPRQGKFPPRKKREELRNVMYLVDIDKRWIWAAAGAAGVVGLLLLSRLRPESKGRRVWRRVKARRQREREEQMERGPEEKKE